MRSPPPPALPSPSSPSSAGSRCSRTTCGCMACRACPTPSATPRRRRLGMMMHYVIWCSVPIERGFAAIGLVRWPSPSSAWPCRRLTVALAANDWFAAAGIVYIAAAPRHPRGRVGPPPGRPRRPARCSIRLLDRWGEWLALAAWAAVAASWLRLDRDLSAGSQMGATRERAPSRWGSPSRAASCSAPADRPALGWRCSPRSRVSLGISPRPLLAGASSSSSFVDRHRAQPPDLCGHPAARPPGLTGAPVSLRSMAEAPDRHAHEQPERDHVGEQRPAAIAHQRQGHAHHRQ